MMHIRQRRSSHTASDSKGKIIESNPTIRILTITVRNPGGAGGHYSSGRILPTRLLASLEGTQSSYHYHRFWMGLGGPTSRKVVS